LPASDESRQLLLEAAAGDDLEVSANQSISLDGSASKGADIVAYQWRQLSGTVVDFTDAKTAIASFVAPRRTIEKQLVFEMTVRDSLGEVSTDTVTLTLAPVANDNPWHELISSLEITIDSNPDMPAVQRQAYEYQINQLRAL